MASPELGFRNDSIPSNQAEFAENGASAPNPESIISPDPESRNQQVAGSIPAGGSRCGDDILPPEGRNIFVAGELACSPRWYRTPEAE